MRCKLFNLLTVFILILSTKVWSQDTNTISIDVKNSPLKEVLTTIESQSSYIFSYNNKKINVNKPVTVSFKNKSINNALANVLKNYLLTIK